jgi:hypothetical protein
MSLGPGDVNNGWWMISREAPLPPGEWQLRAWVRDLRSGEAGLVTGQLSIPDIERTYLSTLMLSDRTAPASEPGEPPHVVPTALRHFGSAGDVVCQYEVFNFGGHGIAGLPQLTGGYTLQRDGDILPAVSTLTPIEKAGARAVRRIVLPLRELEDGRYTIAVTVRDALTRRTLVSRESFVVERSGSASAQDD